MYQKQGRMNITENNQSIPLKQSIMPAIWLVTFLWCIKSAETLFGFSLHTLGVFPGEFSGLIGVLFAPFIHGSYEHLAGNSLALLILISAMEYGYPKSKWRVYGIIWLLSGLGVWFFGRESFHFGASGLTHGLFFYLFISSILRRDKRSVVLMMIAFFMYGGMVLTIFPREQHISFEYHLFGAIAGLICAFVFRNKDPKLKEKTYAWENTSESDEDDIIGDEWKMEKEHTNDSSPLYTVEINDRNTNDRN